MHRRDDLLAIMEDNGKEWKDIVGFDDGHILTNNFM
jgi:hypothetical protein